jgi:hypothetical protein
VRVDDHAGVGNAASAEPFGFGGLGDVAGQSSGLNGGNSCLVGSRPTGDRWVLHLGQGQCQPPEDRSAYASGVTRHRIHVLSGLGRNTVDRILGFAADSSVTAPEGGDQA